jgi:uncharacterized DUF497 family protein
LPAVLFEWDERKRRANLAKHGIDFDTVRRMFQTAVVEREDQRRDYGEKRVVAHGEVDGKVLCVIYTWRDGACRIISARRARRDERKDYYAGTSRPDSS